MTQCTASTTPYPDIEPVITYHCTRVNCDGQHSAPMKWRRVVNDVKIVEEIPNNPTIFTWDDEFARRNEWEFTPSAERTS